MFQFHGWLTISASPGDVEDDDDAVTVRQVEDFVRNVEVPPGLFDLRTVNGQLQLHFGGFTNHFSPDVHELLGAVRQIATLAPGTYGLVYIYDDEDPHGKENEFQVLVVARGHVSEQRDSFLSPFMPVVEDELD